MDIHIGIGVFISIVYVVLINWVYIREYKTKNQNKIQ